MLYIDNSGHIKKLCDTLEPMGFKHEGDGNFSHPMLSCQFDFSATSYDPKVLMNAIIISAKKEGKKEKSRNIRKAIDCVREACE